MCAPNSISPPVEISPAIVSVPQKPSVRGQGSSPRRERQWLIPRRKNTPATPVVGVFCSLVQPIVPGGRSRLHAGSVCAQRDKQSACTKLAGRSWPALAANLATDSPSPNEKRMKRGACRTWPPFYTAGRSCLPQSLSLDGWEPVAVHQKRVPTLLRTIAPLLHARPALLFFPLYTILRTLR